MSDERPQSTNRPDGGRNPDSPAGDDHAAYLEKLALLGRLTAGIAHEINTPLGALRNNCDLFAKMVDKLKELVFSDRQVGGSHQQDQLRQLFASFDELNEVNKTAGERIAEIVDTVRTYARQQSDAGRQQIDLHALLDSTLTLAGHELKGRIEVHKYYGMLRPVSGHANQLSQVFLNLIVNASQAIEGSGNISLTTSMRENMAVIQVADDGKGIRPENLNRIFSVGFTTKKSGMGLGLSIVGETIRQHGGTIFVDSTPGAGTSFTISLPTVE